MSDARTILSAALDEIADQAGSISGEYEARFDEYRVHLDALLADLAAGKITQEQAIEAAEQGRNALVSTLVTAGLEARAATQQAALSVALAVLRAGIVALA